MVYLRFLNFLLLFLLGSISLFAQEFPYSLDWRKETTLLGVGAGLSVVTHSLETQLEGLSPEEISTLRRTDVWGFDRGATRQESSTFRRISDQTLRGAALVPATLLASRAVRSRPLVLGVMFAETMLLNDGFTKMTKLLVRRNRPLLYNLNYNSETQIKNDARQSFVSGHTSNAAALSFFTAKVFHDLYPESNWRHVVWAGAATIPLVTGYARYRAGKHFPTDIMAGYVLGASLGILIPQWHKTPDQEGFSVGLTGDGVGVSLRW